MPQDKPIVWIPASSPTDIVTTIDTWAEKEIMNFLNVQRPNDEIIGEEGIAVAGSSELNDHDPIDGTTNFFYGFPVHTHWSCHQ